MIGALQNILGQLIIPASGLCFDSYTAVKGRKSVDKMIFITKDRRRYWLNKMQLLIS